MDENYKKQLFNIVGCNQTIKAPDAVFNCSTTTGVGRYSSSSRSSSSSSTSTTSSSNSCCPQYACCSSSSSTVREDFCNCGDSRFPEEPINGDDISPRGRGNWNKIPTCCRCALGYYRVNPIINSDCGKGPFNSPCDNFGCTSQPGDWAGSFQGMCKEAHPNMEWKIRESYWCNGGRQPNTPNTADQFLCVKGICICKPPPGLCRTENWWYGQHVCLRCKENQTSSSTTSSSTTSSTTSGSTSTSTSSSAEACQNCCCYCVCETCCRDNTCYVGPSDGYTGPCCQTEAECNAGCGGGDLTGDYLKNNLELSEPYVINPNLNFNYYIPYIYDNAIFKEKTQNIITDCTNTESPPCWCNDTCNITVEEQNNLYNKDILINNIENGLLTEKLTIQNTFLKDGILYESENDMFNESQDQINNM